MGEPVSLHEQTAARFEAEGRRAFERSSGPNPYNAGTMAHDRWAKGFMDALHKAGKAGHSV